MSDLPEAEEVEEEAADWLGTFADISLLLLTFFILMVSMSTIDTERFNSTFSSVRGTFGGLEEKNVPTDLQQQQEKQTITMEMVRVREEMLEAQRKAYNQIRSYLNQKSVENTIGAVFDEGIITLNVPGDVLFGPGEDTLGPAAEPALQALLEIFKGNRDMHINIKGYSDNSPVPPGARYHDNWELSALRAVNVLRWFVEAGIPVVRFTASGLGDLDPRFPNDTPENRAKNRRVEFVLEREVSATK